MKVFDMSLPDGIYAHPDCYDWIVSHTIELIEACKDRRWQGTLRFYRNRIMESNSAMMVNCGRIVFHHKNVMPFIHGGLEYMICEVMP